MWARLRDILQTFCRNPDENPKKKKYGTLSGFFSRSDFESFHTRLKIWAELEALTMAAGSGDTSSLSDDDFQRVALSVALALLNPGIIINSTCQLVVLLCPQSRQIGM
jgi:hypothetical protein